MIGTFEQFELLRQLHSGRCRCGNPKAPGRSFCKECYFRLPHSFRQQLYQRFGQGYERAYAAAVKALYGDVDHEGPLARARAADAESMGGEAA